MKIKLTEKFSLKRKGDTIDVSELTAEALIAEGKATAVTSKAKPAKEKEAPKEDVKEPEQEGSKTIEIE